MTHAVFNTILLLKAKRLLLILHLLLQALPLQISKQAFLLDAGVPEVAINIDAEREWGSTAEKMQRCCLLFVISRDVERPSRRGWNIGILKHHKSS